MIKQFLKERVGTIILFVIVIVFVIWGVFSIKKARENAITFSDNYEEPEGNVDFNNPGIYVSIARTNRLELFYNEANGAIQVKDLESNYLWKAICDNDVYDLTKLNKQWTQYLTSPISITYNDLKKRDSGGRTVYAAKECKQLSQEYIDNGVAVTYGFTASGIYVTVEYILDDDQLVVRIPVEKIEEKSKYAITVLELMPFMGASINDVGGYLFYPDGSGAITTYEKADTRPSNIKLSTYYAYTNRFVNFMNLWNDDTYNQYTASMPVYGIKNGDHALFAAFMKGGENTAVKVYPAGYVVNLNHMGFELYLRNVYNVNMYSMSTGSDTAGTAGALQRVDKQLIPGEKEVRFFFLNNEKANYSGMASVYRDYLIEEGLLKDAIAQGDGMPLALDLLMGVTKDGIIFDEYISMTDFGQVQQILERLGQQGISDMQTVLYSWAKNNGDYENWPPASQLGGKGGLKDLNEYLTANTGQNVYLANSLLYATSNTRGIQTKRDVAHDGLNTEISMKVYDGTIYYLLNPLAVSRRNSQFLDKVKKYDQFGISYNGIGGVAYADFNENAQFTKGETIEKYKEIMGEASGAGRKVAAGGAHQYTYSSVDYLHDLREESFGLDITDYAVPFVQMVMSGMIPYSTEGAGNLAYDLQVQKLKWVEYGAIPYFYLTYESAQKLRDTGYDTLFSSTYGDWEHVVVDTYKEFKENLDCVYGQQIVDHAILTDDLIRVKYANGVTVYVNYGDTEVTADNVKIPAKDYVVNRGGEQR